MLRRLHPEQPDSFAFTSDNQAWAEAQITKYPEGRQASAIIPLLWRAQEQEGWLTRPAIEHVADMLDLAHIRALEVATFYFMFQLAPVGAVAHIQICGTLSCMICGAEDLVAVAKEKIAAKPHQISADGKFSWEEVECLGACSNAPMAQIGKDYYEDLTAESFAGIIDAMARGEVPTPGPQNGRYASEPAGGLTSLTDHEAGRDDLNISARMAMDIGDTIKRIDGTEVPLLAPWGRQSGDGLPAEAERPAPANRAKGKPADTTGVAKAEAPAKSKAKPPSKADPVPTAEVEEQAPELLTAARDGGADDLKRISGVGPKLEGVLNDLGFYHFDQIAAWGPAEIAWVDARLKFKGRIERDDWVSQAAAFAVEG
ncbi:NADH-quinone oxidoreductase subunit E [Rhodobacteraceae bacterium N5(2021)]|uniref:NADH-quinone oxidoreductase subunit E n=1 Tax=Gymnodinialimonas phycosphaerae TaxID=2841589 RepID=A0A975YFV8_9RHOB|nr:NADH-quinone oxidoreductase subunit E [Gymnodinialimonas phycosphaerae]MBY4895202.1 NADH-quinone oxidoreductase subunit E [Gymnodinialimonas phycosphaerae]